jgi:MFS transporter, SP family, solute carrier family 2 (myo-inositol transporter), member 13
MTPSKTKLPPALAWNLRYLLLIAGLGGLLYGIDVGIIAGALPYLQDTAGLTSGQLSIIVAAVLLGSVISTAFAGLLADLMGRKKLMTLSGIAFVASIPMIALAHGFGPLVLGRILQGVSAGIVGVVVPLYLAECLSASDRGKGTGMFQWLLTLGIFSAAVIAWLFSFRVEHIEQTHNAAALFAFKDLAWRSIFWVSALPGALFVVGSLFVAESPRWLFQRGRKDAALAALLRTRTPEQADHELKEMEELAEAERTKVNSTGTKVKESILRRKYVIPFVLACVILAFNQATGINSIIGYHATILIQAGLGDASAHFGYVILTLANFLMTMVAMLLVDRKGRKFLLTLGSAGIVLTLMAAGLIFRQTERQRVDLREAVQAMVQPDQTVNLAYNQETADQLLAGTPIAGRPSTLVVIYSYGDFRSASKVVRSTDTLCQVKLTRESCVPADFWAAVAARISNPMANAAKARTAPLRIENALATPVPSSHNGWLVAIFTFIFIAFYAVGPGVCVWLALSELMPTRIRSNGMSVALLLNQAVSTTIAAVFLPTVGRYGYGTMFFIFAGCTVVYFLTALFFLPETKGKTLEEIEAHFEGK